MSPLLMLLLMSLLERRDPTVVELPPNRPPHMLGPLGNRPPVGGFLGAALNGPLNG